ncbi:hypothetical protein PPL_08641 [Heterostelium album PN500]|uniref:MRH domain-containing protein n=1 Tax=Heterostelium pallidum (strain ATCC 26659 / Pp 5 / PN500) TaxID=670386 RepID=D3BJB6_HETP5|nr:hypothetical protein PPL_08641 [Heterostelium album PN500]EFA77996.1 hypothetical protein PPL_08641 [Heterostelium album PN500]|eukprot:XP_020430124.1 hypothetical protein PPL_08641 [Heterostelium album PN500]
MDLSYHTIAIVSAQNCKLNANGQNYDFSKLANSTSWSVQDASRNTYYFNICQAASKCEAIDQQCSVCQQAPSYTQPKVNCGQASYANVNSLSNGVAGGSITYTGGTLCHSGIARSTEIQMMCTSGPTQILSATEVSACTYVIKLNSNLACPTTTTTTTSSSWNSTTGSPTSSSWNSTTGAPFTTYGTTTFNPTTTTTTSPSSGGVTTHTTTTSDDYLTTTNTVTARENYDSYVVINTTTVSSDTATLTTTVTSTIKSGEISNIVTTTTYTEGTSTTTDTQTQKKRLGLTISPDRIEIFEIEPEEANDSSSLKSNSLMLILISAFILLLSSF